MNRPKLQTNGRQGNLPAFTLVAVVALVGLGLIGALRAQNDRVLLLMVGLIVTTVPALIAAGFAERVSRDVRNGVIKESVSDALNETGVPDPDTLRAVKALLENLRAEDTRRRNLIEGDKRHER